MIPYSIERSDFSAIFYAKVNSRAGILAEPLDENSRKRLQSNNGIKVLTVVEGSPAYAAEVIDGDLVLRIGEDIVISVDGYYGLLDKYSGRVVKFVIERDGRTLEKQIEIRTLRRPFVHTEQAALTGKLVATSLSQEEVSWNEKSLASANKGEWVDAIRTASVAISLNKNFVAAFINRCRAYTAHRDFDEALSDCNAALALDPTSSIAINNVGVILENMGKTQESLPKYYAACEAGFDLGCENFKLIKGYSPKEKIRFSQSKLDEANVFFGDKKWEMAIASASSAIEVNSANGSAYVTRAGAYANTGRLDKALEDSESAIRINPDDGVAYNNRGYVFELSNKTKPALLDYEIACGLRVDLACKNFKRLSQ
jgi:tetratricopeptide (TPR) repeat protein